MPLAPAVIDPDLHGLTVRGPLYGHRMLAHETSGSGRPLLLIHGLTESRRMWDPLVPALAADHLVLRVDLSGHGESGPSEAGYGPDVMADQVAAVVDATG